jgi:ATP-binding cassette subfamily B protein
MRARPVTPTWRFNRDLMRRAPRPYAVYFICNSIFGGLDDIMPAFIVQAIFNRLSGHATLLSIPVLIALYVALEIGRFAFSFGMVWGDVTFRLGTGALLRRNILAAILDRAGAMPLPVSPGAAVNRFRDDVDETSDFPTWFPQEFTDIVGSLIAFAIMASIDRTITLFVFLPLIAVFVIARVCWDRLRQWIFDADAATDQVTSFLAESFGAVQAVKLAGVTELVATHFDRLNQDRGHHTVRWRILYQAMNSTTATTLAIGTGIVLLLGAHAMADHSFTIGDFALFIYLLQYTAEGSADFGNFLGDWANQGISIFRMEELVQPKPPEVLLEPHPVVPEPLLGTGNHAPSRLAVLEATGLTCLHGAGEGIHDISLTLERGSLTVVTGRVGAGKTTLLRALTGLLPLDAGGIRWNGESVADPATFFQPPLSAYVPQAPILFSESLSDNIALGWPVEAMRQALRTAALEDEIDNFPDGLDTIVGPRGVRLSGGQIQRVAAARALIRTPELLVVDDLSSALDVQTEETVWDQLLADRRMTILAASHRRSTLARATTIIILDRGAVVARGTLAELLETSPHMTALFESYGANG